MWSKTKQRNKFAVVRLISHGFLSLVSIWARRCRNSRESEALQRIPFVMTKEQVGRALSISHLLFTSTQ